MGLPVNLDDLINRKTIESTRIEFKQGWNPEEITHSVCAFANDLRSEGGGYIIIGIAEQNGSPVLPPVGVEQNQIDKIQKEFLNLCFQIQPNFFPVFEAVDFQGKFIIVIWVTNGEQRPYTAPSTLGQKGQRRIYVRPVSASIPATQELEKQLRDLATFIYFDDRICTRSVIDDLDLGLIQSYLQEVKSNLYNESLSLPLADIAAKMQIARGPQENVKPLNVGLLMFSREPHKYFEGAVTNLLEFEDEAGTKYSPKTFTGPIHLQIREILGYLKNNVIKQYINKTAGRTETDQFFNYPYQVLKEAIVNALYHRSYENPTPNEIRIFKSFKKGVDKTEDPRRIEVLSYPGPLPPIDEQALVQLKIIARNYRNIRLGDWLKNLGLAEKHATGIPTIVETLRNNGSPSPILSTDTARSYFLVVIKIHESAPIEGDDMVIELERIQLSNDQQKALELLLSAPSFESDIIKELGETSKEAIQFLLDKSLIGSKLIGENNLLYINASGISALKQSF